MEPETKIYGASDDLIYVVGNVTEELHANYDEPTHVRVGKWRFIVEYNIDGEWIINVVEHPDGQMWTHLSVGNPECPKSYSETVSFYVPSGVGVEKMSGGDDNRKN